MSKAKRIKKIGKKQLMFGARVRGKAKRRQERREEKAKAKETE